MTKYYDSLIETRNINVDGISEWVVQKKDNAFEEIISAWKQTNRDVYKRNIKNFGICVQAGGYMGLYPRLFSEWFTNIYSFEPNPLNFHCLVANCQKENITKINGVLGARAGMVTMYSQEYIPETNPGMNKILDDTMGHVPQFKIDDLSLPSCGFIQLDIETYELQALYGAEQTIKKFHPTIAVEIGLDPMCGDDIKEFLKQFGYERVDRCRMPGGDHIYAIPKPYGMID